MNILINRNIIALLIHILFYLVLSVKILLLNMSSEVTFEEYSIRILGAAVENLTVEQRLTLHGQFLQEYPPGKHYIVS